MTRDITELFTHIFSFSSLCGGTTSTSCCLVILISDVPKRLLYHRMLNCTSVSIPGRLYSLKYYILYDMGMGELRVKIEHTLGRRSEGRAKNSFVAALLQVEKEKSQ